MKAMEMILKILISCLISGLATFIVSYSGYYLVHNAGLFFISLIFSPGMSVILINLNFSEELIFFLAWLITTFYYCLLLKYIDFKLFKKFPSRYINRPNKNHDWFLDISWHVMIKNIINAIFCIGFVQILGGFVYHIFFREHNSSLYLMLVKAIFYTVALVLFALPGIVIILNKKFGYNVNNNSVTIFSAFILSAFSQLPLTSPNYHFELGLKLGFLMCAVAYWSHLLMNKINFYGRSSTSGRGKFFLKLYILFYLIGIALLVTDSFLKIVGALIVYLIIFLLYMVMAVGYIVSLIF